MESVSTPPKRDIVKLGDEYINTLYFKSQHDFQNGFHEGILAKLLGLDSGQASNVKRYLAGKNLLDLKSGTGSNVVISSDGIDYALKLREGKVYKTISFKDAKHLSSALDGIQYIFSYVLIQEDGETEFKKISITIAGNLSTSWGFRVWREQPDKDYRNLIKILLQYGKNRIIEKIREGTLQETEELILMPPNHPLKCPYTPENLVELKDAEYEVEIAKPKIGDVVSPRKKSAEATKGGYFKKSNRYSVW